MLKECYLTSCLRNGDGNISHHILDGHSVICLWEDSYYGELLRQWIIDGENVSKTHRNKYTNDFLLFEGANGLLGNPFYDEGSSSLNELLRPLGIAPDFFRQKNGEILITRYVWDQVLEIKGGVKSLYPKLEARLAQEGKDVK